MRPIGQMDRQVISWCGGLCKSTLVALQRYRMNRMANGVPSRRWVIKVGKALDSAGVLEVVEDAKSGTHRVYSAVQRSGLGAALFSQEEYEWNRHVETRSHSHPC